MLVHFQYRGVLLIGIIAVQGPIALAEVAVCFFLFFSLSLGDCPIQIDILSKRAIKPKSTNLPTRKKRTACNFIFRSVDNGLR